MSPHGRNHALDSLRGAAILGMFADHLAAEAGQASLDPFEARFFLRLVEPTFICLMGYYLVGRSRASLAHSLARVCVAALLANAFYLPAVGKLEILASITAALAVAYVFRDKASKLWWLFVLAPWDPSAALLDYPLTIVLAQSAVGMTLRRGDINASLAFLIAPWWMAPPLSAVCLFTPVAALLTLLLSQFPTRSLPGLTTLGRRPLTAYVLQFPVLWLLRPFVFK